MTTTLNEPKQEKKTEKVRVLGTIIVEPQEKTSAKGNVYTSLVVATSNGLGKDKDTIWNATIMDKLRQRLPKDLFKRFSYAKFNGLGSHRPYQKDGQTFMAHDLLVDSVTMPDGTIVYQEEKKEKPENADEDAPF